MTNEEIIKEFERYNFDPVLHSKGRIYIDSVQVLDFLLSSRQKAQREAVLRFIDSEIERKKGMRITDYDVRLGGWKGIINQLKNKWDEDLFVDSIKDTLNQSIDKDLSHFNKLKD